MKDANNITNRAPQMSVNPTKSARKKLLGKWGLRGLVILAVLMVGATLYTYFYLANPFVGYRTTSSMEKVQFQVGSHHFEIPKAYIWDREQWSGGKFRGVNMHATVPDFRPYSEDTKTEFHPGGRKVIFSINNQPGFSAEKDFNLYREEYALTQQPNPGPYGFLVYPLKHGAVANELLVRKKNDGELYSLKCRKVGTVPFPSCQTAVSFDKDLMVTYHFPLAYLENWEQIDTRIRALIHSFEKGHS